MNQNPLPLDARGAVDLGAIKQAASPQAQAAQAKAEASGGTIVNLTLENLQDTLSPQHNYPIVLNVSVSYSPQAQEMTAELERLAVDKAGAFQLVNLDAEAVPQLAQSLQVQSYPTVFAVLRGQPMPLFQGPVPVEQLGELIDQVIAAAAQNGVTGTVEVQEVAEEEPEEELPPLHQAAYDAIERDDLPAAIAAYEQALTENPDDELAQMGIAQVHLLQRVENVDLQVARKAAADNPKDVQAQMLVADLDVSGGKVEDAFARLLDTIAASTGEDKDAAREHLIVLFDVVGPGDERVKTARKHLARLLY